MCDLTTNKEINSTLKSRFERDSERSNDFYLILEISESSPINLEIEND